MNSKGVNFKLTLDNPELMMKSKKKIGVFRIVLRYLVWGAIAFFLHLQRGPIKNF